MLAEAGCNDDTYTTAGFVMPRHCTGRLEYHRRRSTMVLCDEECSAAESTSVGCFANIPRELYRRRPRLHQHGTYNDPEVRDISLCGKILSDI